MLKRQSNPRPSDNTVYVIIAINLSPLLVYLNIERKCRGPFEKGCLYGHVTCLIPSPGLLRMAMLIPRYNSYPFALIA